MKRILISLFVTFSTQLAATPLQIALTFDDLPYIWETPPSGYSNQKLIQDMISVLEKHNVLGVFAFVNGGKVKGPTDKKILDLWVQHGHLIGNHTWGHTDLNTSTPTEYIAEIDQNHDFLVAYGRSFYPYFRYPFLHEGNTHERRAQVRNHLMKADYRIAQVTIDHNDWEWYLPFSRCYSRHAEAKIKTLREMYDSEAMENLKAAQMLSQFLFKRSIKHIALMHPNVMTVEQLDTTLTNWTKAGAEFITLQDAIKDPAYEVDPNIVSESPNLFTDQIRHMRGLKNPPEVLKIFRRTEEIEKSLQKICLD
ncbi:MAG: polysaccharide deacetylase family protein [Legionellaceae bacterium]